MYLTLIPVEIICYITKKLTLKERASLCETCKYLYQLHKSNDNLFSECKKIYLSKKWHEDTLLTILKKIMNNQQLFNEYYNIYRDLLCIKETHDDYFGMSCEYGCVDTADFFLKKFMGLRTEHITNGFRRSLEGSNFDTCVWLFNKYPKLKCWIHRATLPYYLMYDTCIRIKNLNMLKWVIETFEISNKCINFNVIFHDSVVYHNNSNIAMWALLSDSNIVNSECSDELFREVCMLNYLEIARFFCAARPKRYNISYQDGSIYYRINNWERDRTEYNRNNVD